MWLRDFLGFPKRSLDAASHEPRKRFSLYPAMLQAMLA